MARPWWYSEDRGLAFALIAADVHYRHPQMWSVGDPTRPETERLDLLTLAALHTISEESLA